jgi:hypothetical protein
VALQRCVRVVPILLLLLLLLLPGLAALLRIPTLWLQCQLLEVLVWLLLLLHWCRLVVPTSHRGWALLLIRRHTVATPATLRGSTHAVIE